MFHPTSSRWVFLLALVAVALMVTLSQQELGPAKLLVGASSYGHEKGHVHVNVWRGPSKGHYKKKFAPWGYYAKLPADDAPKYKHY